MLLPSEASRTSLLLLGRFGLKLDSGGRISVSSRKGCALLAYLAMQPEYAASRERLATLLWGDRSDGLARQNLRQCLSSLRRELPPAVAKHLLVESDSVGLSAAALSVDAREFAALAEFERPGCARARLRSLPRPVSFRDRRRIRSIRRMGGGGTSAVRINRGARIDKLRSARRCGGPRCAGDQYGRTAGCNRPVARGLAAACPAHLREASRPRRRARAGP